MSFGLAAVTLAGLAGTCAQAASPGVKDVAAVRAEAELAQPAPVPGTFDFQLARLGSAPHAGPVAAPAAAAPDPARPDVGVARRFVDAAWVFESYTRKVGALDGAFADGAAVSRAVTASASYEPSQLAQGAVAWGALVALQDAGFVDAVRGAAPDAASRDALAAELLARPAAVLRLPGAREAAQRVGDLVGRRGAALIDAGASVNKASYSVQKSAWSKASLDKPAERLVAVKALGAHHAEAAPAETAELMASLATLRPGAMQSRAAPDDWRPTPAVARSVALAALALLGRAGEDHAAEVAPLLVTAQGEDCLKMAKLNLNQCLAVAGPRYEDMFCMGRHAVADTGQCVVSTAGWTAPPPAPAAPPRLIAAATPVVAPPLAAATRVEPAVQVAAAAPPPVAVPIALAALDGPERAAALAPPPPPVEAAPAAALEAAAPAPVLARAAPPPSDEPDPGPSRPRWSRPVLDADEADLASPAPRRYARAEAEDDGDAAPAPRTLDRRRYAPDRDYAADRYARRDDRDDDDLDEPPPRPAAYRWNAPPPPGYGYGRYAPYGYGYGPGGR